MTCKPWCTHHLIDEHRHIDACLADDHHLSFGDRGDYALAVTDATTDLTQGLNDPVPSIMLHFNGDPVADLDPHQAAALAWSLLSQVAQVNGDPAAAHYYQGLADEHAHTARALHVARRQP